MKFVLTLLISIFISHSIFFGVFAHEGPAYPISVDRPINGAKLSIWADPDTGKGTFMLFLEGEKTSNFTINMVAFPVDDPIHILKTTAQLSNEGEKRSTYSAALPFDRSIIWNIEFSLKQNGNTVSTFMLPLNVTPPGPNKLEFAVYFLPFLLLGFVWVRVVIAKRKRSAS
ncbi:MAG: hypothetical protein PHY93_16320 [Bacteriovorax sp.]|nr:hypothetical protein [Bacteriovorax sp.]